MYYLELSISSIYSTLPKSVYCLGISMSLWGPKQIDVSGHLVSLLSCGLSSPYKNYWDLQNIFLKTIPHLMLVCCNGLIGLETLEKRRKNGGEKKGKEIMDSISTWSWKNSHQWVLAQTVPPLPLEMMGG